MKKELVLDSTKLLGYKIVVPTKKRHIGAKIGKLPEDKTRLGAKVGKQPS